MVYNILESGVSEKVILFAFIAIFLLQGCSERPFIYEDGYTDCIVTEDGWENTFLFESYNAGKVHDGFVMLNK